jgi:hypothetical protein
MSTFRRDNGNWTEFRRLPNLVEVDFHWSDGGPREVAYWEAMDKVYRVALESIRNAHADGGSYVLMTHGSSTSQGWNRETARSVIRGLMRSKEATPYIVRSQCIQHPSCFVAAIRPKPGGGG